MNQNNKQSTSPNCLLSLAKSNKTSSDFYLPQQNSKTAFSQVWGPQTHLQRRRQIIDAHPQVKLLLIPNKPYTILISISLIILGMIVAYLAKDLKWKLFLPITYFVGATIAHTLHVCIHDFTHYSGHSNILINKMMAIFCNIPMGIPSAIAFGKYHANHHNFLGEVGKDPDLPCDLECKLFQYRLWRPIYYSCQTLVYALRPILCYPIKMWPSEIFNFAFIFAIDYLLYVLWGPNIILYLILVSFFSIGPHPLAIHVIAEHFQYASGLQTYDYFGICNIFNLNMGYHIQHHDFPSCPWYNLPKIRAIASQFYEPFPFHTSYYGVIKKLLFDPKFGYYHRTVRNLTTDQQHTKSGNVCNGSIEKQNYKNTQNGNIINVQQNSSKQCEQKQF